MNEKLQYASMLEIPVNTCNITYAPAKRRKARTKKVRETDDVKKRLLDKLNNSAEESAVTARAEICATDNVGDDPAENVVKDGEIANVAETMQRAEIPAIKKRKSKFSVAAAVELVAIGVLIAVICLTNALYENSAINVFMRGVFGKEDGTAQTQTDSRTYGEFSPVIAYNGTEAPVIEDGVMTLAGKGSVYAIADGKVTAVTVDGAGKYSLEIAHSDNFKTVLTGLDYSYAEVNDKVFGNIPVGYCGDGGIKMCFLDVDGAVITDYSLDGNAVVWKAA